MKFQFCGNINCPEWFIAQISVLTKITAVKIKLIFSQLIAYFMQNADITPKVAKLLNGTGLDHYQMHSVVATLKFILQNSITFNVSDVILNKQLIDLGLPKQNVQSITKTYKTNKDKLLAKSGQNVLKTTGDIKLEYSIHQFLGSSKTGLVKNFTNSKPTFAQISLTYENLIQNQNQKTNFIITNSQLDYLIYQIQNGLQTMEKLEKLQNKRNLEQQEN